MPLLKRAAPFDDPDWIYELKMDGFRALAIELSYQSHLSKFSQNLRDFNQGSVFGVAPVISRGLRFVSGFPSHLENADLDTRTRDSRMAERPSGCYCRSRADADSSPAHAVATPEPAVR